jgi:phosphoesterase RecJ-like protein
MHQKPDGDAMGSSLGLYHFLIQFGHRATVISPTNWAGFLQWMPDANKVVDFEAKHYEAQIITEQADLIFCLDFNVLHRTKHFAKIIEQSKAEKILIDHHQQPQVEVFAYGISDIHKSSTCEMVYDFIINSGNADKLNLNIAQCLYTGVITDTGSFRFPITSASVHTMVAHLKTLGLQHTIIHENIYDNFLENRLRFTGFVLLNRMEVLYEYNAAIMSVSKQDLLTFNIEKTRTRKK